jgi:ubiquinone biosynthesis protein UbiJ
MGDMTDTSDIDELAQIVKDRLKPYSFDAESALQELCDRLAEARDANEILRLEIAGYQDDVFRLESDVDDLRWHIDMLEGDSNP